MIPEGSSGRFEGGDYGEDKNEALTAGPHGEERLLTRRFGGRKCCPELGRDCFFTEEEFVEAYKNRNEICEIDFDGGDHLQFDSDGDIDLYHDALEDEEGIEVFECKEFTAEDRIAFAYDSGDFSFATCKEILDESCGDALKSEGDRKRVVQGASGQATLGFYVHGGVSGVTKAVVNHTVLARYLNGFIRAHVGDGATWGAISVIKGGSVKVHHDYNNAAGSRNYFTSFGQEAGGELWVHDSSIKEVDLQDNKDGEIVWKQAGSGDWLPGRLVDAQEKFVEFDPLVKHQVLDSEGEAWRVVAYTPRGTESIKPDLAKFLKNCGFPLPTKKRGSGSLAKSRPTKKQRSSITNVVGKSSVLFTTLLAAANSFLGECIQTEVINDPIVLLEIGGFDATLDATELNKAVLEPLSWEDYGDPSIKKRALYLVKAATPRQLHLHLRHAPEEAFSDLKELVREQLHGGGAVLLQGGEPRRVVEDVDHYVRYKNNHEGEEWTVLARPGAKNLETPCSLNPHHVLVVSEEEAKIEERPLRIDGSGITFDKGVPGHVRAALKRLHQNLGHPRGPDLVRHLRLAGCESSVIKAAKGMRCQVCEATKEPQVARPTTLPRMLSFGEIVCADILYAHDCEDKRHTFLSLVDVGTTYHVVVKLRNTGGKEIEQAFNTYWLAPFGAPNAISLDLETGLQDGFSRLCSWHNVKIRNSATQAHFQSGVGERQGKWFKNIWIRVCRELSITADEAQLAATSVCCAKNSLRRRCGHSPSAWIFGREARGVEHALDPDSGGRVTFDISDDARFQRQMAIRASARIAFHKSENDGKLRKALLQRARATTRPFENGEQVHYWNLPKNRRQGRWEGPAIVVGREGNNYWVSRGGRCRLTAPEHLRPSGPDETGEFLAMGQVKRELDQLLDQDFDKNDTYASDDEEGNDVKDDIGTLYSPSENHEDGAEAEDIEEDDRSGQDNEPCAVDDEGDEVLELLPDQDDETGRDQEPTKRGWPTSRMKRKTPPEDVEWKENDTFMAYSAMLMRKHLTKRGLEKRQEKELRWDEIPEQFQQKFRDAECKQWSEHLHYDALEPLDDAETEYVKKHVAGERVLRSRWAYKDKNWSRRRLEGQAEWRCKSRLVIAGHTDPDLATGRLVTDAPTLSRPGLLCLLQLLANGLQHSDPWRVSAGDIQCAFLTGSYLSREEELYIHQPPTGFPGMKPGQLVRVKKNIFGLATSPREWWLDLQEGITKIDIEIAGAHHRFEPCPLDPCIFVLRECSKEKFIGVPKGYVGTHVDDLLVIAATTVSKLIEEGLGHAFPIGEWESELFNYLGSEIYYGDNEVVLSQQAYAESRLFSLDIPRGVDENDLAGPDLVADNRSLVGALSWLSAQSRPDLTCSVSMAQQVQKQPTYADLRFTNLVSKKAVDYKEEGLRFRPIDFKDLVVIVYHDAGWANAFDTTHDEEGFELTEEDKKAGLQREGPFVQKSGRKAKRGNSKVASQLGDLIVFAERRCVMGEAGNFSVLDWKSKAGQRVCRSTFSAETQACIEGAEAGQHVRALFETLIKGELVRVESARVPMLCLSDCRSLYDHVHKQGIPRVPSDRRLAVDLAALRQTLKAEQWTAKLPLGWVASSYQLADILTKPQDPGSWWEFFRSKLLIPINLSEEVSANILLAGERKTSVKHKGEYAVVPSSGEFLLS